MYIYIYTHHSRIHAQVMHPNERPDRFSPCITSPGSSVWRNSWNPSRTKSPLKSPFCNSKMTSTTWLCQWSIYDILEHTKLDRTSTHVLSRLISSLNLYFHMISYQIDSPRLISSRGCSSSVRQKLLVQVGLNESFDIKIAKQVQGGIICTQIM